MRPSHFCDLLHSLCIAKHLHLLQVVLAFRQPFWPAELFDVICVDCFIPEFWVTSYPIADGTPADGHLASHTMVGFVTGQRAVIASALPEAEVVQRTLQQLDRMFGEAHLPGWKAGWPTRAQTGPAEPARIVKQLAQVVRLSAA